MNFIIELLFYLLSLFIIIPMYSSLKKLNYKLTIAYKEKPSKYFSFSTKLDKVKNIETTEIRHNRVGVIGYYFFDLELKETAFFDQNKNPQGYFISVDQELVYYNAEEEIVGRFSYETLELQDANGKVVWYCATDEWATAMAYALFIADCKNTPNGD